MRSPVLLVRADAGFDIGSGHLMRCLALAQGWRDLGGAAVFACATGAAPAAPAPPVARRVEAAGFVVQRLAATPGSEEDAAATIALAEYHGARLVAVDGPHLGAELRGRLAGAGLALLALDDEGGGDHRPDRWVLNQNLHADAASYLRLGSDTRLLLGIRYCLLRDEFLARGASRRRYPRVARRLLVTFGGADPRGATARVLEALVAADPDDLRGFTVEVICGPQNRRRAAVEALASCVPCEVRVRAAVEDMAAPMAAADLAVCAGGSTVWEMAYLGLPALVVPTVPVEERLAEGLEERGLFAVLDRLDDLDERDLLATLLEWASDAERRRRAGALGLRLVDGEGRRRVAEALLAAADDPPRAQEASHA